MQPGVLRLARRLAGAKEEFLVMRITKEQRHLLRQYNDIARGIDSMYDRVAAEMGISPSAFDILYELYVEGDGCSQRELCERCFSNKQTVYSSVHRLAGQGIVKLEHTGWRSSSVTLTDRGRDLAQRAIAPVVAGELATIDSTVDGGAEAFIGIFRSYAQALTSNIARNIERATGYTISVSAEDAHTEGNPAPPGGVADPAVAASVHTDGSRKRATSRKGALK